MPSSAWAREKAEELLPCTYADCHREIGRHGATCLANDRPALAAVLDAERQRAEAAERVLDVLHPLHAAGALPEEVDAAMDAWVAQWRAGSAAPPAAPPPEKPPQDDRCGECDLPYSPYGNHQPGCSLDPLAPAAPPEPPGGDEHHDATPTPEEIAAGHPAVESEHDGHRYRDEKGRLRFRGDACEADCDEPGTETDGESWWCPEHMPPGPVPPEPSDPLVEASKESRRLRRAKALDRLDFILERALRPYKDDPHSIEDLLDQARVVTLTISEFESEANRAEAVAARRSSRKEPGDG